MVENAAPGNTARMRVAAEDLRRFVVEVFAAVGMPSGEAETVADVLVWANLRGVDSHGVTRLPRYLEMIEQGLMNIAARPVLRDLAPSLFVVDADRAAGAVALTYALKELTARARLTGVAVAAVGPMTHSGALGYYTQKVAADGMACVAVNSTIPLMPYHGARGAALGSNPISIAVPGAGADPMVFDMATSAVSAGKLMLARRSGTPLEPGTAVDADGKPTTDPKAAEMATPLGGPKGAGLALMIECLASLLSGHPIVAEALGKTGEGSRHRQNALLIAIDVARFVDLAVFRDQVAELVAALKALPLAPGSDAILMPGERGYRAAAQRSREGIPLPPPVIAELTAIAEQRALKPLVLM